MVGKHDWYQTEKEVVVTVLLKDVQQGDCELDITPTSLNLKIAKFDYSLSVPHLGGRIVPDQCSTKLTASKVEVKLRKAEGVRWDKLEGSDENSSVPKPPMARLEPTAAPLSTYPSSAKHTHDWDKLAADITREEKDEKLEGDAALNKLFQQIYSDGTEETKRAMVKSFQESGGTCLSTNWKEVGKDKVEVKPPDGMEFKKWDQ